MPSRPTTAVLGFRPHTYWTAAVALAGPAEAPRVLERRRMEFAAGHERFVYHQAEDMALPQAEALLDDVRVATTANAAGEIATLLTDLRGDGVAVQIAVTAAGTARLPERLEDILRVHARIHAAEGTFYRDVVAAACGDLGLTVHRVVERDVPTALAARLGVDGTKLEARLKAMGEALGPPWNEDYRLATQAAWSGLAA